MKLNLEFIFFCGQVYARAASGILFHLGDYRQGATKKQSVRWLSKSNCGANQVKIASVAAE
jgi:hypothetical protein